MWAVLLWGCGGAGSGGSTASPPPSSADASTRVFADPRDMAARPVYPPGPYGTDIGSTVADFAIQGYPLSPATPDRKQLAFGPIHLADVRNARACDCILVTTDAAWCSDCQEEQSALEAAVARDPALCVMELLAESTRPGHAAQKSDLDTWVDHFGMKFPVGLGPRGAGGALPDGGTGYPSVVAIAPGTMQLVAIESGWTHGRPVDASLCDR